MKKLIVLMMSLAFVVACSSSPKDEVVIDEKISTEIIELESTIEEQIKTTDQDLLEIEAELNNLNL